MELITLLNRSHRFRGFVYQRARFSADKRSKEVAVRPRKGSAAVCSRCHLPAPGYDQLAERRFKFIPLWGLLVFLLYTMRRVGCRRWGNVMFMELTEGHIEAANRVELSEPVGEVRAPVATQDYSRFTDSWKPPTPSCDALLAWT